MNKSGHVALGVALGTGYIWSTRSPTTWLDWGVAGLTLAAVAVGSLAPDIDHRTSTASNLLTPFSGRTRKTLRKGALLSFLVGVFFMIIAMWPGTVSFATEIPPALTKSYPLWLGGAVLLYTFVILRDLILLGVGAGLLYAYSLYQLEWFWAFAGGALLIMPLVRHRGIIHTPEFAYCLTVGLISVVDNQPWYYQAIGHGFAIGWVAHLVGDLFGMEGIQSVFARFIPALKKWLTIALRLFRNGGKAEQFVIRLSWSTNVLMISAMLVHWPPEKVFQQLLHFVS